MTRQLSDELMLALYQECDDAERKEGMPDINSVLVRKALADLVEARKQRRALRDALRVVADDDDPEYGCAHCGAAKEALAKTEDGNG